MISSGLTAEKTGATFGEVNVTKTPPPRRASTTPISSSAESASRTGARLTPNRSMSTRSGGRRSPIRHRPSSMSRTISRAIRT